MEFCRDLTEVMRYYIGLLKLGVFNIMSSLLKTLFLSSHMVEDLRLLSEKIEGIEKNSSHVVRQKQMQVLDLERNILQVQYCHRFWSSDAF